MCERRSHRHSRPDFGYQYQSDFPFGERRKHHHHMKQFWSEPEPANYWQGKRHHYHHHRHEHPPFGPCKGQFEKQFYHSQYQPFSFPRPFGPCEKHHHYGHHNPRYGPSSRTCPPFRSFRVPSPFDGYHCNQPPFRSFGPCTSLYGSRQFIPCEKHHNHYHHGPQFDQYGPFRGTSPQCGSFKTPSQFGGHHHHQNFPFYQVSPPFERPRTSCPFSRPCQFERHHGHEIPSCRPCPSFGKYEKHRHQCTKYSSFPLFSCPESYIKRCQYERKCPGKLCYTCPKLISKCRKQHLLHKLRRRRWGPCNESSYSSESYYSPLPSQKRRFRNRFGRFPRRYHLHYHKFHHIHHFHKKNWQI